jgi:ribosomal protein L37E
MASVYIEQRGSFECDRCGNESECDPFPATTVVCATCGHTNRVGETGYMVQDWNKKNRKQAKELAEARNAMKPKA